MQGPLAQTADQVGDDGLGQAQGLQPYDLVTLERLDPLHCQSKRVTQPHMTQTGGVNLTRIFSKYFISSLKIIYMSFILPGRE